MAKTDMHVLWDKEWEIVLVSLQSDGLLGSSAGA